jgi:putative lipase involved disintegration of autophagic bodies
MTRKKEKKTVFKALLESRVCFAVCVDSSSFINREVAAFSKDYFVIINKCDEKRVKEFTFYPTEGYKQVCERNLSTEEIKVFRSIMDKFVKVLSNEYGRVYELKGRSFKSAYNSIRKKLRCK